MKITEKYINSKNGDLTKCEDGIFINKNFIAIIDGCTSKGKENWGNNKKSGLFAKEIVLNALSKLKFDINAEETLNYLFEEIRKQYKKKGLEFFINNPKERLECSVIIYSKNKKEIWNYGDCQCLINGKVFSHRKKINDITSLTRSLYNNIQLNKGLNIDDLERKDLGREYILPLLENQSIFSNINHFLGYPVLNGINFNKSLLKVYKVKAGEQIILASDGYPVLKNTLLESEKKLKKILEKDPLFIKEYKSTKGLAKGNISYDDRSYIKFIDD